MCEKKMLGCERIGKKIAHYLLIYMHTIEKDDMLSRNAIIVYTYIFSK